MKVVCTIDRAKRPMWMKRILSALSNTQWKYYDGTLEELKGIRAGIDHIIRQLELSGQIGVKVTTEIATGNALLVKKSKKAFITAQFEND